MSIKKPFRDSVAVLILVILSGCSLVPREATERSNQKAFANHGYVVLVSIDGYRYDYTDIFAPPVLKKFRREGSSAAGLIPIYPSKTFTNHYSIATGLYAENHGIVANAFYDPDRKEEYRISNPKVSRDGSWYGGEPLWVAAEKQKMLAADFFWPGGSAAIQGVRPTYYNQYDESIPLNDRVKQVRRWLDLPEERRPHLITLYFSDVDTAGHQFGPRSKEVAKAISRVDSAIGALLAELNHLDFPVNVVIVSDHGMEEVDSTHVEYLDDYVDLSPFRVIGDGAQVLLYSEDPNKIESIYKALKLNGKHFKIYKRNEVPASLHYSKNSRCGDLLVIPDSPYSVGKRSSKLGAIRGNHGFDPARTDSMKGIFYARGPQVKSGIVLKPFQNIHIYPFIIHLLGLKMNALIDGDPSVLVPLHKDVQNKNVQNRDVQNKDVQSLKGVSRSADLPQEVLINE